MLTSPSRRFLETSAPVATVLTSPSRRFFNAWSPRIASLGTSTPGGKCYALAHYCDLSQPAPATPRPHSKRHSKTAARPRHSKTTLLLRIQSRLRLLRIHQEDDVDIVVRTLKKHLSLEIHYAFFFGRLEGPDERLVELFDFLIIEQLSEFDNDFAIRVPLAETRNVFAKFLYLAINRLLMGHNS